MQAVSIALTDRRASFYSGTWLPAPARSIASRMNSDSWRRRRTIQEHARAAVETAGLVELRAPGMHAAGIPTTAHHRQESACPDRTLSPSAGSLRSAGTSALGRTGIGRAAMQSEGRASTLCSPPMTRSQSLRME